MKKVFFFLTALTSSYVFAETKVITTPVPSANPPVVVQNVVPNNDCVITTNVLSNINADSLLAGQAIRVSTVQGVVSLDGTVSSADKITAAIAQARLVAGVVTVKSYLNVQSGATNPNGEI